MKAKATDLAQNLQAVLHGAAKIVGCSSTHLVLFDEKAKRIRVHLGATADAVPLIARIEGMLGARLQGFSWPIASAERSMVSRCWRERVFCATRSLKELVGRALSPSTCSAVERLIGQRSYACVPALGGTRSYGVLLFEKEGCQPFNRQQREVLVRYARRVGEILENDLMGQSQSLLAQLPDSSSLENQLVRLTLGEPAPALFLDPGLRITSCNSATEQLLGVDSTALCGQPIGGLFSVPDEVMAILTNQTLDPQRSFSTRATVMRQADGALVPVHAEALLLADDNHHLVGFLLVLRTPAQRDAVHVEEQERLATMGEMAAHLAHEIRNPLVAIGATLESLVRDHATPPGHRTILTALAKEIVRMDMTLRDYLAARREIVVSRVRVSELVEEARRLLSEGSRRAGKTIRCQVNPDLAIEADYDGLRQVVFNLLLNALEASPEGGEVVCQVARHGFELAITVEDRGPGLLASAADCLRPFFTTKKNGTGLGLAVCDKIAHAHGGFVDLRNRSGGGCQATLVLPAARGLRESAG